MNQEFWWNFAISMVIPVLQTAIHDPGKRASIKKVMLKIAGLIQAAYANDPDFTPKAIAAKAQSEVAKLTS